MAGRFVTLEGGEGVGKSTQLGLLAEAIRARGHDVVTTREPGGSAGAEAIRALLLEGEAQRWDATAEALLFAAARADHVAKLIRPAIAREQWVLCDRFLDSSLAYQGAASGIAAADLLELHRIGSGGLLPDRTLLLALPIPAAARRADERDHGLADRFGGRGEAFHAAVVEAFAALAGAAPERVRKVDATGSPAAVTARLLAALEDLL